MIVFKYLHYREYLRQEVLCTLCAVAQVSINWLIVCKESDLGFSGPLPGAQIVRFSGHWTLSRNEDINPISNGMEIIT